MPEFVLNPRNPKNESYEEAVQSLLRMAREIYGEGFEDAQESEILELIIPETEKLSVLDIEEMVYQEIKENPKDPRRIQKKIFIHGVL